MKTINWIEKEGKLFNGYMNQGIKRENAMILASTDIKAMKYELVYTETKQELDSLKNKTLVFGYSEWEIRKIMELEKILKSY
jgi:hypothetical protein